MRYLLFIIVLLGLFSCSSELDDVKKEIEELERNAQKLQQEREKLEKENAEQDKKNQEDEAKIDSAEHQLGTAILRSMEFLMEDNPNQLVSDEKCKIIGDSIVECWIPYLMPNKKLIPRFDYKGSSITINGTNCISRLSVCDFSKPVKVVVSSRFESKVYNVYVHSFTGLPVLWIETTDREGFTNNDDYMNASFRLVEDVATRSSGDVVEDKIKIKREGNAVSFISKYDGASHTGKNSYIIKLSRSLSMLNEPSSDDWALSAMDRDKSMLRCQTGLYLGLLSRFSRSIKYHYVELMLNGRFCGTYLLGDRTEIGRHRFEIKTDGLTMMIEGEDENSSNISSFVNEVEKALFSSNFTDTDTGWQKYLDMESFADWYVINEILKNGDGSSSFDCFASISDGKLEMGPLTRFDMSFGANNNSVQGLVVNKTKWFNRLLQDPFFESEVKKRMNFYYEKKDDVINEIEANVQYLRFSAVENSKRWEVFEADSDYCIYYQYQSEVNLLIEWFKSRMNWLNNELNK